MRRRLTTAFGKSYFSGDASRYTTCYLYKSNNLRYVFKEKMMPLLKVGKHKTTILDIGCAFGTLLNFCDELGLETYGIDISSYALRQATKRTIAKLRQGDVNEPLPYSKNYFDYVAAFDIIEHLVSPYKFVLEIKRVLKKSGYLFIHTPNINSIFERIYQEKWFGYRDLTHIYLFNRKSIAFLLKKVGFTITHCETIFYPLPSRLRNLVSSTDVGGTIWVVAQKD